MAARMLVRPIRPKPFMPTWIAMPGNSSRSAIRPTQTPDTTKTHRPVVPALYTVAVVVLAVVLSPWFLYQAVRYRKYIGSLTQRMGRLPVSFNLDGDESIWVHAVSVGE